MLGAVVPSYNLPGIILPVRFTPAALAGIYLGRVTRWNDPELVKANPDLPLPAHDLTVVFRTDGSGTTYIWTDYLRMPDDFRISITNAADSDAYPISSFSWLLVPEHIGNPAKRQAITGFLRWVLTDGQKLAKPMYYAPLPAEVANRELKAVDRIQ